MSACERCEGGGRLEYALDGSDTRYTVACPSCSGYDDLLTAYSAETSEANRLRKLFDDAGQGEHNVLALVDHYQRTAMEADERLLAARKVVEGLREYLATDIHVPRHINARRLDALAGLLAEYDKAVGG